MFKIMTLKQKNRYDIESYTRKTHYRRAHTDAKIFHAVTWLDVKSITHTDELYSLHIDEYIGYSCSIYTQEKIHDTVSPSSLFKNYWTVGKVKIGSDVNYFSIDN